jgi:hypothetical protein
MKTFKTVFIGILVIASLTLAAVSVLDLVERKAQATQAVFVATEKVKLLQIKKEENDKLLLAAANELVQWKDVRKKMQQRETMFKASLDAAKNEVKAAEKSITEPASKNIIERFKEIFQ